MAIRAHFTWVLLASLALAGGTVWWLCALPDGTRHTLRREPHVFVNLFGAAVAGVSLYLAVVFPVALHAVSRRWPFRLFVVPAVVFGFLNVGPLVHFLEYAEEPYRGEGMLYDNLWGVMLSLGLLALYMLYAACVFGWVLLPRARWRPAGEGGRPS